VNEEKLAKLILARAGLSDGCFRYAVSKNGRLDRRKIIDLSTGQEIENDISTSTMASWSPYEEDADIHSSLYSFLSRYTHPHILAIHHYLDTSGFRATGRDMCLETIFYGTFVGALGLDALSALPQIPNQLRKDINFFLKRPRSSVLKFVQLNKKENSYGDLFRGIVERTKHFGKPWPVWAYNKSLNSTNHAPSDR
jgi:hypothetical protein